MTLFKSFALISAVLMTGPALAQSAGAASPIDAQTAASDLAAPRAGPQTEVAAEPVTSSPETTALAEGVGPHAAAEIAFEPQRYHTRPLVVFADSAENPQFVQQMILLNRNLPDLAERRVVVVVDTDPEAQTEWRKILRPRGFSLVLLDTDLKPVWRKPSPWDVREVSRSIDRLPSRRQDLLQQFPGR